MKFSLGFIFCFLFTSIFYSVSFAASDDLHKYDSKWFQFNLMQSVDNKIPYKNKNDTYLEMEFGGRSGVFDLYGYLDIFDIFDSPQSDRHGGDNFFFKFAPRISINSLFDEEKYSGFISEVYFSTLLNVGDSSLFEQYVGLGSDLNVPWLGTVGANLMARYVRENYDNANEKRWDGYLLSTNWFKPLLNFEMGTLAYQGYLDYKFAATQLQSNPDFSKDSLEYFNGIYLHTPRYALGYGLKYYHNMALLKDGGAAGNTTGFGHYFALTYKF